MARVVIVIVNWNGEAFLPACLHALRDQSFRDFEIVLVDNASSDGSVEHARQHVPEAQIVHNHSNLGFAEANNIGIAKALANPAVDYVLTLNNDTIPARDFVEKLVVAADRSPGDYGSWQGKVVFADDPRVIDAVGVELTRDSIASQVGHCEVDAGQYESGEIWGVNAAAALYSRCFIEDVTVGGEFFDRDFFSYLEDVDVAVRGASAGWKAAYVADAVVRHVRSASTGTESTFRWRCTGRNKLFLQLKNYTLRDVVVSIAPTLREELRLVVGFMRTSERDVARAYLGGHASALSGLSPMLGKRRAIIGRRRAPTIFAPVRPRPSPVVPGVRMSVVIPNWNGEEELRECLAALREQTLPGIEVIVVDNGSTDGSVKFVREQHPEVVVLAFAHNLGFATAVNLGINASNGEFVALLNNDAVADRQWAAELIAAMDHADIAASLMLKYDEPELSDSRGEYLSKWGIPYRHGHGQSISDMSLDGYPEIFAASGGASIYRRAVFEDIGVFDPQFFAYLEDVDFSFRARLAGYRVVLAPRARVLHKVGATARHLGHFQLHQFIKNSQLLVWKNLPLPTLIKVLPRFGIIQAHLLAAAVRRRAVPSALKAHLAIAVTFPMILWKRWKVQRLRTIPPQEIDRWLTDHWPMNNRPSLPLVGQLVRERVGAAMRLRLSESHSRAR